MVQLATRVDDEDGKTFKDLTKRLGTTPADAIRMFVMAFNANRGFPYEVRLSDAQPFESEKEAVNFIDDLATETISDTR